MASPQQIWSRYLRLHREAREYRIYVDRVWQLLLSGLTGDLNGPFPR